MRIRKHFTAMQAAGHVSSNAVELEVLRARCKELEAENRSLQVVKDACRLRSLQDLCPEERINKTAPIKHGCAHLRRVPKLTKEHHQRASPLPRRMLCSISTY
eukprot:395318-Pelagomonas_calceolata.AAC.1